ncbi:MAG: hypothetical protein QM765_27355 [Myxococcales bacterium]
MAMLKRAVKNGAFSVGTQVVVLALGLLFAGMTIRYLGTARAGFFVVAQLILGWFGVAGVGGFRAAAIHRLASLGAASDWKTSRAVLGTIHSANIAIAVPFAVVSVAAFPYLFTWSRLEDSQRWDAWCVVVLGAVTFLLDQSSATLRAVYNAHQRFDLVMYLSFAFGLFGNVARLVVLIEVQTMASLALVNVIISLVTVGVDVLLTRRLLHGWTVLAFRKEELRPLMRFGLWAWSGDIIGALAINVGNMVTTYFLGSAPLPYITLPQRIAGQVHTFFANTCYFLFPTLAAEGGDAASAFAGVEDRLRWFVAAASWALYAALVLAGPLLLTLLAGADFAEKAYPALVVFAAIMAVNAMNIVYSFASMAVGKIHPSVVAENASSLLTTASGAWLIPSLGYMGACWAAAWKGPAVVFQCAWSRRVLGLTNTLRAEWAPYLSPAVAVVVCLGAAKAVRVAAGGSSWLVTTLMLLVGGAAYFVVVWRMETGILARRERWSTVLRAVNVMKRRLMPEKTTEVPLPSEGK